MAARKGSDLAAILYTSGTTGRSKGAMLTSDNLWSNTATLHAFWGFRPDDVLIHALPLYHTHGLFVALNLMLLNGGRMILLPKFEPERVIRLMSRATLLMGVPTFYTRLLASPALTREAAAGMRLFVSGSAPLLASTHQEFEARTGQRILERYGMTETGMNASNPLVGERRAGTVGKALPGVELRVCGADGREVPAGEVGVLEVRGPNVFAGYWRLPEKTAEEMRPDGFFVTGDMARIEADGYVTIVGRAKDLIISGGLNVYPKEIEQAIDALPGVIESAVVGVPHPDFGEAVVAVVTGAPGTWWRRCAGSSRGSSCRSTWRWWTSCRATPWGRCRRTCCASGSPGSLRAELVWRRLALGPPASFTDPPSLGWLTGHSVSAILHICDGPSRRSVRPSMRDWRRFRRTFARK